MLISTEICPTITSPYLAQHCRRRNRNELPATLSGGGSIAGLAVAAYAVGPGLVQAEAAEALVEVALDAQLQTYETFTILQ